MKRTLWCRLFGCKMVVVRAGFPFKDEWFARCDRLYCDMRTVTVKGSPWPSREEATND